MRCGWSWGIGLLMLFGCGDGTKPTSSLFDAQDRQSILLVEEAPVGWEAAVSMDSVSWLPTAVLPAPGQTLEILGDYAIAFRNDSDAGIDLRNDLRFYDDDDFIVDNYIPFGLPLHLPARSTTWQRGEFVLRGGADAARFGLRILRIAVKLTLTEAADSGG